MSEVQRSSERSLTVVADRSSIASLTSSRNDHTYESTHFSIARSISSWFVFVGRPCKGGEEVEKLKSSGSKERCTLFLLAGSLGSGEVSFSNQK